MVTGNFLILDVEVKPLFFFFLHIPSKMTFNLNSILFRVTVCCLLTRKTCAFVFPFTSVTSSPSAIAVIWWCVVLLYLTTNCPIMRTERPQAKVNDVFSKEGKEGKMGRKAVMMVLRRSRHFLVVLSTNIDDTWRCTFGFVSSFSVRGFCTLFSHYLIAHHRRQTHVNDRAPECLIVPIRQQQFPLLLFYY